MFSRVFVICLTVLFIAAASNASAGYLQAYSGNAHASTTTGLEIIDNFAVLDQDSGGSTPGDVFGTGLSNFDSLASIDTTARYLYLYQVTPINTAFGGFGVSDSTPRFTDVTSSATWNLALEDNGGIVSTSNSFGADSAPFMSNAPAMTGVTASDIVADGTLSPVSLSISATTFTGNFPGNLAAGSTSELFGFTTNIAPTLVPPPSPGPSLATATVPAPVPEPSSILLMAIGGATIAFAARRRLASVNRQAV